MIAQLINNPKIFFQKLKKKSSCPCQLSKQKCYSIINSDTLKANRKQKKNFSWGFLAEIKITNLGKKEFSRQTFA
jgi:hypothetical protein